MPQTIFAPTGLFHGQIAYWAVFTLGVIYAITLLLGLLSLKSPQDPISDPYFTILELLIIIMAPLMVVCMVLLNAYAPQDARLYSEMALVFMIIAACITCCVHFVILTVSRQIATAGMTSAPWLFSFTWPSVAYALDILAWDFFFALAMLFAAAIFSGGGTAGTIRVLLLSSGILSLVGLIGVPLADMRVRMIGVVGYAGLAPVAFLLMGILFGQV